MSDEKYIEILHIGAFDEEPASFHKMDLNELEITTERYT